MQQLDITVTINGKLKKCEKIFDNISVSILTLSLRWNGQYHQFYYLVITVSSVSRVIWVLLHNYNLLLYNAVSQYLLADVFRSILMIDVGHMFTSINMQKVAWFIEESTL